MLTSNRGHQAKLHYMANSFRVLAGGDHVLCASSGAAIMLDELRYWSVARQQPYATAAASLEAEQAARSDR